MPTYASAGSTGGQHGISQIVWNAETPATGNGGASASEAVALPENFFTKLRGFSVAGYFAGAPGAYEVDVQTTDVDADAQYQTIAGGVINTADATNYTFAMDVPQNTKKFARLLCRTQNANDVAVTARITPC